jgi:nardilysin
MQGPACLYVSPAVKDHHEVTVSFQLPCLRHNYRNKPEHYISHLVGHEGPGSLLSALKVGNGQHVLMATGLCAGY